MYTFQNPYLPLKECLEIKLLNFYCDIFQKEIPVTNGSVTLVKSLKKLKGSYSKQIISNRSSDVTFECPQMRCSYVFQFAPCFSSIAAHYFSRILHSLPWLLEKLLFAEEINICCLGGGPATEFIAIATVLEDMLWRYYPRGDRPLNLKATVIDIDSGWSASAKKINDNFVHLVDTSIINCQLSFVQADLTRPPSEEVQNILSSSDIVTMSKFMTAVQGTSERTDIMDTLQMIFQHIRRDGILLFLDSSGFEHYDALRDIANSFEDIFQIYGIWEQEVYEMSQIFLLQCYRFYSKFYTPYKVCCFKSRNYVSAWHRRKFSITISKAFIKTKGNKDSATKKKKLQRSASF